MSISIRTFIRDPLFHFLVIGGMLFALFSWIGEPGPETPRVIRLTESEIEAMQKFWEKTHFRLPTETELEALIEHRIKEEVFYREALALGMSEADPLIRRRLAQKVEFLSEGLVDPGEPSEADLRAYAKANSERFQEPARVSFQHIYLNPERRGKNLDRDAGALLISMKNSHDVEDASAAGDPILLNSHFDSISPTSLTGFFGEEFAQAVMELPSGEWQGPVPSSYGLHLVYVYERTEARTPEFTDIRDTVREALLKKRRRDAANSLFDSLRERYQIVVERPMSQDFSQLSQDQKE